jgi:hypothetical protein
MTSIVNLVKKQKITVMCFVCQYNFVLYYGTYERLWCRDDLQADDQLTSRTDASITGDFTWLAVFDYFSTSDYNYVVVTIIDEQAAAHS